MFTTKQDNTNQLHMLCIHGFFLFFKLAGNPFDIGRNVFSTIQFQCEISAFMKVSRVPQI